MNRERRKALGKVFFDVAKYLLTTAAVGSFVIHDPSFVVGAVATLFSFAIIAVAFYVTPPDKKDKEE